ncbi:MAG: DUF3737 family protein [Prevotella sp.]|nr:DUF3737 family protein [Prevotella sp.]
MKNIKDKKFGGERPLFGVRDTSLENIEIADGESGIKCCENITCDNSRFYGKYPWWHVDNSVITNCYFAPASRSAIWYSNDMIMKDTVIDGPKFFREMNYLSLENVKLTDADETFWRVDGLKLKNVELHGGTYPFMFSKNIYVDGLWSDSFYMFQYCQNVEVHNAKIVTRDAFWECENVTVYDSDLNGEYMAWHSKNIKLVRCHISGEQPFCYMDNITLEGCTFDVESDRIFEDCTNINADIRGTITNIKNPISGRIVVDKVGSITYDEFAKGHDCEIVERT